MHQVRADGMPPGHVAPVDAEGVVLKEQVVLALVEHQSIGVIGPILAWREVKLWPVCFVIELSGHQVQLSHGTSALKISASPSAVSVKVDSIAGMNTDCPR